MLLLPVTLWRIGVLLTMKLFAFARFLFLQAHAIIILDLITLLCYKYKINQQNSFVPQLIIGLMFLTSVQRTKSVPQKGHLYNLFIFKALIYQELVNNYVSYIQTLPLYTQDVF